MVESLSTNNEVIYSNINMKFTFQICIRYSFENAYIAHFGNMINLKNPKLHKNKPEEEICYPLPLRILQRNFFLQWINQHATHQFLGYGGAVQLIENFVISLLFYMTSGLCESQIYYLVKSSFSLRQLCYISMKSQSVTHIIS